MADVPITPDQSTDAGVAPTVQVMAAADNYIIRNNGRVALRVSKVGAGAANITIVTPKTIGSLMVEERVVAVPSGEVRYIGPLNPDTYNDPSGDLDVSTDEDTDCQLEVIGL
ncbi:MAG: hypothetical protein GY898_23225 [Proteobacteria bacterium]|nr:hypothetical protein [Pseudomonadota bacterium]